MLPIISDHTNYVCTHVAFRIISQLRSVLKTKEFIIEQQEEEKKDAIKEGEEKIRSLQKENSRKDKEIQVSPAESARSAASLPVKTDT